MKIIALSGKIGTGKTYIANYLNLIIPRSVILAFADHLKCSVIAETGIDPTRVFGEKDAESRKMLQTVGTAHRINFGEDYYVNYVRAMIAMYSYQKIDTIIIPDVRYKNEARALQEMGATLVRLDAPMRNLDKLKQEKNGEEIAKHSSETDLDDFPFKFVFYKDYDYYEPDELKKLRTYLGV